MMAEVISRVYGNADNAAPTGGGERAQRQPGTAPLLHCRRLWSSALLEGGGGLTHPGVVTAGDVADERAVLPGLDESYPLK
jgi:hypothetical protein